MLHYSILHDIITYMPQIVSLLQSEEIGVRCSAALSLGCPPANFGFPAGCDER